jgi:hypothetical protein
VPEPEPEELLAPAALLELDEDSLELGESLVLLDDELEALSEDDVAPAPAVSFFSEVEEPDLVLERLSVL